MEEKVKEDLGEKIVEVVKTIYDPEIPVDIFELGLIYKIDVEDDRTVKIDITYITKLDKVEEQQLMPDQPGLIITLGAAAAGGEPGRSFLP